MFKTIRLLAAAILLAGLPRLALADGAHMAIFTRQGSFADIRESVEMAITGRLRN
jgi:hypothetical protein